MTYKDKDYQKKYREKNKEKQKKYHRKWREENKERIKEYGKKYYKENSEQVKVHSKKYYEENTVKAKEYNKKYYEENTKKRRSDFLSDKSCLECGSTENLELHHRNPDDKESSKFWSWSEERMLEEIAKCDVLCHDCHVSEHAKIKAGRL